MRYFKGADSFETLKENLMNDPLITTYIHTFRFTYYCDFSDGFLLKTNDQKIIDMVKKETSLVEIDETAAGLKFYTRNKSICYFGQA